MATMYCGGTHCSVLTRSSASRCSCQNSAPAEMRLSVRKICRYCHHCSTRSAGRPMLSMICGCARACLSTLRTALRLSPSRRATCAANFASCACGKGCPGSAAAARTPAAPMAAASARNTSVGMDRGTSGAHELPVGVEGHQNTEAGEHGHHRASPIADERQRDADDREEPGDHSGIDEDVHEESQRDAAGEQT